MDLAKPSLDVGLYVRDVDASRAFYEGEIGLPYEELLKVGGGIHQHRLGLRGSVLKLNASRAELPTAPSGYRRILIAGDRPRDLVDPDGVAIAVVSADDVVTALGIEVASADVDAHLEFYVAALGGTRVDDTSCTIGTTVVRVVGDPSAVADANAPMLGAGFRYITVQVHDVVAEHERIVGLGYQEAMQPRKLGEVAAISFVRDPGGNWIEISQRASLTGDLPSRL